jgi:glycosyltransferase involved in cell wall biosynthesis
MREFASGLHLRALTVLSLPAKHASAGPAWPKASNKPSRLDPPLVSVIIPAYNAERFLSTTLASARRQTHKNLEIIVVDDGSTDSTAAIAMEAADVDKRIRVLRQDNFGVAAARNRGIAESRGDYIAPLDADDVWHPQNVALQVAALEEAGPETAVSYAWCIVINEHGGFRAVVPHSKIQNRRRALACLIEGNFVGNASSSVIRRDAILAVGGYDTSLRARNAEGCEDQALYIALAERSDFAVVSRELIAYRSHPYSMSQDTARMKRSHILCVDDLRCRRPDLPGYWFGRGMAQFHENHLTSALRRRDWNDLADVVSRAAQDGRWCLFDLIARRLGPRVVRYLKFRLNLNSPAVKKPRVEVFWPTEHS